MSSFFGVQFAPLNIPIRRRIQTLAVLIAYNVSFLVLSLVYFFWHSRFWPLLLLYFAWLYIDRDTCRKGGRQFKIFRRSILSRYVAEYFPMHLHKTAELSPEKNYIIGYHPHGIFGLGVFNFLSDATGFNVKYPGINPRCATLNINFWLPFHRDFVMARGMISADKESIKWVLSNNGKGNAVVIVVGGAAESLDAVPGTMMLTLKNRKGFARIALETGASLVPCISFGENEAFSQSLHGEESFFKKFQRRIRRVTTFALPLFHGRGIFQYTFGFMPYRKPINVVVGKPIDVEKVENPKEEDVDRLHNLYIKSLAELFYAHRLNYSENKEMNIVIK